MTIVKKVTSYIKRIDDGDNEDEERTHDKTSRFRKVATLFILAMWTLGDLVAPEQEVAVMMIMMMYI